MNKTQRSVEAVIAFSRWLILPMLLGLVVGLGIILWKFALHLWQVIIALPGAADTEVVVEVLKLADFVLVGYLMLIIIFSGYSNFIRRIDPAEHPDWPAWITDVDFTATKQKLLSTVVVIGVLAAIEVYLHLDSMTDLSKLGWLIAFLLTIVVSTIGLAIADRIAGTKG
ncbi:MAG: YqhA family protein [Xanthobacteraceae bacterium]|jgi:uncharacterized protein (TIGR00645 family)